MASYNRDKFIPPVTIVLKYVVEIKSVYESVKRSLKAIDRLRSAYVNAVISPLVRIMIKCMQQAEKQKGCSADVSRSGSSLKTSFE